MFCPKCGKSDQEENTYCRQCGVFLPDLSKINGDKIQTPEEQFRLSIVFNLLSAVAGISMAVALLIFHWGNENVHPVIYSAISLFTVISIWQIVSFVNNLKLRKRFIRKDDEKSESEIERNLINPETKELLPEADFSDAVPFTVTENTTKNLKEKVKRSA